MAKKNKKNKKVKIRQRRSIAERLRTIPGPVKGGGVLLLAALAVGGGAFAAWRYAHDNTSLVFRVERIQLGGMPSWLDTATRDELRNPVAGILPAEVHVLDRKPLEELAAYYAAQEWVRRVDRLEYVFPGGGAPGGIVGSLTLTEPLCIVAHEPTGTFFFADCSGRRLGGPVADLPPRELRLPVITWAENLHSPERGKPWSEEKVLHGFFIAALLKDEGLRTAYRHWIAKIDVRYVGNRKRSEILLVTENRVGLQWGRSTRSGFSGRTPYASTEDKLARVRRVLAADLAGHEGKELFLFEPLEDQLRGSGWLSVRPP